jgi:hypothetical protein
MRRLIVVACAASTTSCAPASPVCPLPGGTASARVAFTSAVERRFVADVESGPRRFVLARERDETGAEVNDVVLDEDEPQVREYAVACRTGADEGCERTGFALPDLPATVSVRVTELDADGDVARAWTARDVDVVYSVTFDEGDDPECAVRSFVGVAVVEAGAP